MDYITTTHNPLSNQIVNIIQRTLNASKPDSVLLMHHIMSAL